MPKKMKKEAVLYGCGAGHDHNAGELCREVLRFRRNEKVRHAGRSFQIRNGIF